MLGRNSLAALAAALFFFSCATTPRGEDEDDDEAPVQVEGLSSSSVRIERRRKGPAIAHVERACEVAEVQRVIELLGAAGARRVSLKVENGPQAEVFTRVPKKPGRWLVVAVTDTGFRLHLADAEALAAKGKLALAGEGQEVPLRDGKPDWERLTNLVRALAASGGELGGASVAAPPGSRADRAIEALQQLRFALPRAQRRTLVAL